MEIDQDSNLEFSVDAEFLESVLQNLPGADGGNEGFLQAIDEMNKEDKSKDEDSTQE